MANRSSSAQSKDAPTYLQNYEQSLNLVNQIRTAHKFDERELKLCGFIDKIPLNAVKFLWDVLIKKAHSSANFTIDQLYCHLQKADPKIQHIIRNQKDLKNFLSTFPNVFTIDNEKVFLSNAIVQSDGHMKWIKRLLQDDYPGINKTVVNAIQFYSDILYDKEDNFPIVNLVTHRNKAKQDVQIIAINPTELKSFLVAYPQVFKINGDKVSLTYSAACEINDCSWLGEMCGMKVQTPGIRLLGKAIIYYLIILFKKGVSCHLPDLFNFRNVASKDIKELTTTVADLKKLFVQYICVFQINKNNVIIKDSLFINMKKDEMSLRNKKGSDLSIAELISMVKENLINTALDVCVRTIKKTLDLKCSLEVPLKELLSEYEYLFDNVDELKMFLSCHPNDFIIKDNLVSLNKSEDVSNIIHPPMKTKISSQNKKVKPVNQSALFEQVKEFCVNFLLQNVGVNVQLPLAQFKQCISLAPPELHQILSNEGELRSIINQFSNVLNMTDNYIILKKSSNDPSIKLANSNANESLMFFVWVLKEKVGVDIEFPIARLKIYVDLAPSEIKIQDIFQLKAFLLKYPDIFIIRYNNVILKKLSDEKFSKYTRYEKMCYVESYSTAEAISFYSRVLNRFCSNLEVPVEHLFGYQSLAPVEVIALAKNPSELKKFLSTHPDIFSVQENNVCLTKYFNRSESNVDVYDDLESSAIRFYTSILDRVSHNNEFPIVRLFGYQYLAPPEVRDFIKTPLELKDFLNKFPKVFIMNNDVVLLKKTISINKNLHFNDKLGQSGSSLKEIESTLNDLSLLAKSDTKNKSNNIKTKNHLAGPLNAGFNSKKSSIIRAIRFYSNIMFTKGPNSEHLISNLLSFRIEATNEIKEIAKKPNELLTFLSKFPQIFTVNKSKCTVMLTDMVSFYKNERNWIKELLPKYHQSTTNHEAVVSGLQFYVNIVFQRGLEVLPIKNLFRYRKTAMADVQTLANSTNDLKDFLSMYPEIFKISEEGVSLTEVAISHKTEPKWIEEIIGGNDLFNESNKSAANEPKKKDLGGNNLSTDKNNDSAVKDAQTLMTINFFKSILENEGKSKNLTNSTLFEYLSIAPQEVKELFKTTSELKEFFLKCSDVFTLKDNYVILVSSKSDSKNKRKKQQRLAKKSNSSQSVDIEGISQKKPESNAPMNKITNSENQLPKVSAKIISESNLISTILFYSNVIWRKGPHLEHSIGIIFSHNNKASNIVRKTVKNTKELKEFLSKYPQLFSVNHEKNTVTLSDLQTFHKNQRSWIKELLPEHHQSTVNHEIIVSTIQFYSNILFEKSPKCELPLPILFSHRNSAMEDVQMTAKNIKELNNFLSMFPHIFIVIKDKVSLTDFVISQLKQPKWIQKLVSSHKSTNISFGQSSDTINEELLKKKKIATRRTVQFYYKIMLSNVSNRGFSLSQLFDYLPEAPNDVQEVVKTISELKNFFSNYPHIFTVNNDMVFLTTFSDK